MAAKRKGKYQGGLAGINYSIISDSYAISAIKGGAVCGSNEGKIIRCYGNCTGKDVSVVTTGEEIHSWMVRKASELQKYDVIEWDFRHIWSHNKEGFPVFKKDNWYASCNLGEKYLIIDTEEKFLNFANQIRMGNKEAAKRNVLLTADLNFKNKKINPVGTKENPYGGIFNGAGHVISNFQITKNDKSAVGLFGETDRAKICNLTVKGNVYGGADTGLLCGICKKTEILCCSAMGEVHGTGFVGGLCGKNLGVIRKCNFYGYIRRKRHCGGLKWLIPVAAIFMMEVGTVTIMAMASPDTSWKGVYKPVERETSIKPIVHDRIEEKSTESNSVTIKIDNEASFDGGKKLLLAMSNPSVSNQDAVMEVLVAKDYIDGRMTYEEAGTYNEQYEYYVVAKTGAIPPGYQIDEFDWLGCSDSTLASGKYPAFVKIYFYDEQTNEKSLIDSLFKITLKIN